MSHPDPYKRSRHASQAYQVSHFGKPIETAKAGYGKRLAGTPLAAIALSIPGDATDLVLGDLTAGLWVHSLVIHNAGTGTLTLTAEDAGAGQPLVDLFTAADLTTVGAVAGTGELLTADRILTATVATGSAAETIEVSLMVCPRDAGWS